VSRAETLGDGRAPNVGRTAEKGRPLRILVAAFIRATVSLALYPLLDERDPFQSPSTTVDGFTA